jgi:hypothetical protein
MIQTERVIEYASLPSPDTLAVFMYYEFCVKSLFVVYDSNMRRRQENLSLNVQSSYSCTALPLITLCKVKERSGLTRIPFVNKKFLRWLGNILYPQWQIEILKDRYLFKLISCH